MGADITDTNDPPVAEPDSFTTPTGQALSVSAPGVLGNDADPDGDTLSAAVVSPPSSGSLRLNSDGSFSYTPDSSFSGPDGFQYEAAGGNGAADTASVYVAVEEDTSGTNDPPVANADSFSTTKGQTLSVGVPGVLENDADPNNDALSAAIVSPLSSGSLNFNSDGSFSYTSDGSFTGTDGFQYEAADGNGAADTANVSVAVEEDTIGTNDPPTAEADSFTTPKGQGRSVSAPGVLGNDSDPDGDTLSASVVNTPSNGTLTLNSDGSFSYDPDSDFTGPDDFRYEVADGNGAADTASVSVVVEEETGSSNDPPAAEVDSFTTPTGQTLSVSAPGVLENDADPNGDTLSAAVVSPPSSGSLSLNSDGSFSYIPDSSFSGPDGFQYEVGDGNGAADTASVSVAVEEGTDITNDPPVAEPDSFTTPTGQTLSVSAPGVLENDADPNGDTLSAAVVSTPANGSLSLSSDGSFSYTPDSSFSGPDDFRYEVIDGNGVADTASVLIVAQTTVPTNLSAVVDSADIQLSWTAPDTGRVSRYYVYRDTSSLSDASGPGAYAPVDSTNGGRSLTDGDLKPGTTYHYRVTAVWADGSESNFSGQATKEPEGLVASQDTSVESTTDPVQVNFESTGTSLNFTQGVNSAGSVSATQYSGEPTNSDIDEDNLSDHRLTIESDADFDEAQVKIALKNIDGIGEPRMLDVYKRDTPGQGTFDKLPTSVDASGDSLVVTTTSFSEFAVASSDDANPLPVELARFDAELEYEAVFLSWTTASEQNNVFFEVQRRVGDGPSLGEGIWTNVGRVNGGGTTTERQSYRLTDENLPHEAEKLTYRLKQVDKNGTAHYSDPRTVQRDVQTVQLLGTFPNPVSQQATVQYVLSEAEAVTVQLYDALGRQVKTIVDKRQQSGRYDAAVDVRGLSSGVYFLRFKAGDTIHTQKLTVVQ